MCGTKNDCTSRNGASEEMPTSKKECRSLVLRKMPNEDLVFQVFNSGMKQSHTPLMQNTIFLRSNETMPQHVRDKVNQGQADDSLSMPKNVIQPMPITSVQCQTNKSTISRRGPPLRALALR